MTTPPRTIAADEIVRYRWVLPESGKVGENDKPSLVAWVANDGEAHVGQGADRVRVVVVRPTRGDSYLRTHADGKGVNNLVNLDTF